MSLSASEDWFSLRVRRNRKSFMYAYLLLIGIMAFVVGVLIYFNVRQRTGEIIHLLFYVPCLVAQYTLTAQRLRDFGVSGWLAFLWLAFIFLPPEYTIAFWLAFAVALCAVPGTKGSNSYGMDPLH